MIHDRLHPDRLKADKLEAEKLSPAEFQLMYTQDLETVKGYLITQHNAGKLNIDKLCMCGAGMGALVGMLWARQDWEWPELATGKQGQDVHSVVLLSPPMGFKAMNMQLITGSPVQSKVAVYVAVGTADPVSMSAANRVVNLFKAYHKADKPEDKDLFFDDTMK